MPPFDAMANAFATFFVTIDPPGQMAIFLALTSGMSSAERRSVALRATLVGFSIIVGFMLVGGPLLQLLGISMPAFRVAGGLLLFYTAFEMVFEKRKERKEESAKRVMSRSEIQSLAVFPLAIPLIAGPGAISAAILLGNDFPWPMDRFVLVGILVLVCALLYLALWLADRLNDYIGETGQIVLTRLFGIILAALSIQFIADGVLKLAATV